MRWHCIFSKLSLFILLALVLASPAAARGNITSGIYPGTLKDVCVGDTIFVGETGLNLTPLTPNAGGTVISLRKFAQDNPHLGATVKIPVPNSYSFDVLSDQVKEYGIYYPVSAEGIVLEAYPIQIQGFISNYPQNVIITSSKDWVVADGIDSALLTITVRDGAGNPISGADLVIGVSTPWGLEDSTLKTDGGGGQTLFRPTTKSGDAIITASASVQGVTTAPVTTTIVQHIDAGNPYSWSALYPNTATVGSPTRISVQVGDRYGNPVTSRRAATNVNFLAGTGGTGAFLDGMGNRLKMIAVPLNETGWAEVTYSMGTNQGDNFIYIAPPAPLSPSLIDIVGIGNSRPFFIFQSVTLPDDLPFIPTGTSAQAIIDYQLLDQWGNPSTDQGIQIVTSAGENKIFYTNQEGHATILYGPKLSAGFYSITATAVANFSVSISQTLQFRGLEPKDMLLTASPQTMASLDVPNATKVGHVYAKVIDERGNPVYGQNVTFAIGISDSSPFNRTGDPAIGIGAVTTSDVGSPLSAVTDENGQAVLDYYPGEFPILGKLGYSEIAQGTTTINALWTDPDGRTVNRSIDLSYKNYRFLSVYTEVNPKTVQTGALVDVSVRLKGDGWALQPKPIDVVLCTDRSATMLNNESISTSGTLVRESVNDRMVDAMNAAIAFVSQTTARDRIGLVTFGKPLGGVALLYDTGDKPLDKNKDPGASRAGRDYACQLDQSCTILANDSTDDKAYVGNYYTGHGATGKDYRVNGDPNVYVESPLDYQNDHKEPITGAIKSIVPAGGTPMRRAIYRSVKQIIDNPRDEAVKAIILLTDGKWGYTGDPRGIVTTGIFGSIESYPEVAAGPQGPGTGSVITWAKDKGIKIFTIALVGKDTADQPNVAELKAYADETGGKPYVADANKEKTDEALWSIYTTIAGELRETVSVDTQVALDFRDVEVNGTYTLPGNQTFNYEFIDGRSTYIIPPAPAKPKTLNNTEDWVTGQRFNIAAGNITVNDEWVVKFTLRALTEGNIKVLSSKSSKVTFTGIGGEVGIPDTYITAMPPGTEKGPEEIACSFENLWRTNEATNTQLVELSWDPVYNGHQPKINWTVGVGSSYSYAPYQWQDPFGWYSYDTKVTYPLIIKDLKPGNYVVKVIGRVSDASSDCTGPDYPLTIPEPAVTPQILIR